MLIKLAVNPALLEDIAANCRVSLELLPLTRFIIDFACQWQIPKIKISTEITDQFLVPEDVLYCGDRRSISTQGYIGF